MRSKESIFNALYSHFTDFEIIHVWDFAVGFEVKISRTKYFLEMSRMAIIDGTKKVHDFLLFGKERQVYDSVRQKE